MEYIESGKEQGAKIHIGGGRVGDEGYFIQVRPPLCHHFCVSSARPIRLAHNFHRYRAAYEDRQGGDLRPRRRSNQV